MDKREIVGKEKNESDQISKGVDNSLQQLKLTNNKPYQQHGVEQIVLDTNAATLSQFAKTWYQDEYSQKVSSATLRVTQSYLANHVVPFFGDTPLREITPIQIIKFYEQKKLQGFSEGTIRRLFNVLSIMFKSAINEGFLDQNPLKGIKVFKHNSKRIFLPLSKEEITRLLYAANLESVGIQFEFALYTGVRLRELLALTWSDIDMDKETVTINRSKLHSRRLSLSPQLVSKLKEHKVKQQLFKDLVGKEYRDQLDLVFPKEHGDIQSPATVCAKLHYLTKKAGIRKITFHDLRKMHVYMLFTAGVSLNIIK